LWEKTGGKVRKGEVKHKERGICFTFQESLSGDREATPAWQYNSLTTNRRKEPQVKTDSAWRRGKKITTWRE